MKLVAAGDSFVWGSELMDCVHCGTYGYSRKTYSALLAEYANMEYVCAAYPGSANNAISRMAVDAVCKHRDSFLLVTWTYPQRYEFRFSDKWISINSWHQTEPDFSKQYFKHVGDSKYYELYSVLKEIVFLQNFCQQNQIPYMFTSANNSYYEHENYFRSADHSIVNLYSSIDWSRWFWFSNGTAINETCAPRGFYQWAIENKYTIAPNGHPTEHAHYDAYMLIREKFNELVAESN